MVDDIILNGKKCPLPDCIINDPNQKLLLKKLVFTISFLIMIFAIYIYPVIACVTNNKTTSFNFLKEFTLKNNSKLKQKVNSKVSYNDD